MSRSKGDLARIIKVWKERLAMQHIEIQVQWDEEPDDEEALAAISPSNLYDYAEVRFRADWPLHDDRQINRLVVHELLHVLFRDYGQAVRSVEVTGCLTADARVIWHDRCNDAEEGLIDRLANRLVDLAGNA